MVFISHCFYSACGSGEKSVVLASWDIRKEDRVSALWIFVRAQISESKIRICWEYSGKGVC